MTSNDLLRALKSTLDIQSQFSEYPIATDLDQSGTAPKLKVSVEVDGAIRLFEVTATDKGAHPSLSIEGGLEI